MPIHTHKLDIATSNPSGTWRIHNQLISNNTRPGTYQFRESIHKTGVVLRTFHFSLSFSLSLLSYLITPHPFLISNTLSPHYFHTCLFLISFLYLLSPSFYINPVDYACNP